MITVAYIAFLTLGIIYVDWYRTRSNWGAKWNGIGCIRDVLMGTADAPMQHRVLVPWVCKLFGKRLMRTYMVIRWCSVAFAMGASSVYFALEGVQPLLGASLLAGFFMIAALYDYTDVYIEVGLFALAFSLLRFPSDTTLLLVSGIALVAALNRETAVFIPMVAALAGEYAIAAVSFCCFAAGHYIPKWRYGPRKRYCEFFMLRRNLRTIKETYSQLDLSVLHNEYTLFFALTALVAMSFAWGWFTDTLGPVEIGMGVFYLAMLVPSMWREIRVFAPVMLAVIPLSMRGV